MVKKIKEEKANQLRWRQTVRDKIKIKNQDYKLRSKEFISRKKNR